MRRAAAIGIVLGAAMPFMAQGAVAQEEGEGNWLSNIFRYGGTTVPPAAPPNVDAAYCPAVDVSDGGAALQAYRGARTGDQAGMRSQISLGDLARECMPHADGSVTVRVGVQARALLGPGGAPGRFEAPVRIVIKHRESVVATRARRLAITVPPGSAQGTASVVEEGIVVPARYARDYEIEVGLGGPAPRERAPRRTRETAGQG